MRTLLAAVTETDPERLTQIAAINALPAATPPAQHLPPPEVPPSSVKKGTGKVETKAGGRAKVAQGGKFDKGPKGGGPLPAVATAAKAKSDELKTAATEESK